MGVKAALDADDYLEDEARAAAGNEVEAAADDD
jgi:hypothetical protein